MRPCRLGGHLCSSFSSSTQIRPVSHGATTLKTSSQSVTTPLPACSELPALSPPNYSTRQQQDRRTSLSPAPFHDPRRAVGDGGGGTIAVAVERAKFPRAIRAGVAGGNAGVAGGEPSATEPARGGQASDTGTARGVGVAHVRKREFGKRNRESQKDSRSCARPNEVSITYGRGP